MLNIQIKQDCFCACCLLNGFYFNTKHYVGLFTSFIYQFFFSEKENEKTIILLVFSVGLNHCVNQWFKPIGLNQANPGLGYERAAIF